MNRKIKKENKVGGLVEKNKKTKKRVIRKER